MKMNNKTTGKAKAHKEKKRLEAEERQAKYSKLSLQEKIAKSVPGSREYIKLMIQSQK